MTETIAFDADVLIYAASAGHAVGLKVRELFKGSDEQPVGVGSVLLLPEVLSKPWRESQESGEVAALLGLLARLELHPVDEATARLAVVLGATYGLRAADSTHLATAVVAGAGRFLTNNRRDFTKATEEVEVIYPEDL